MDDSKNKKSIGMLIMILALVLVAVILIVVIIASSGSSDTTTTQDPAVSSTPVITGDSTGTGDSSGSDTPVTNGTPVTVKPAKPVGPTTQTAPESGKITVTTSSVKSGLLLNISDVNKFDAETNGLFTGDHNTSAADAAAAGFTRVSTKFRTIDNGHFLRTEAIEALAAMIQSFDAAAGTDRPFRVEGYTAAAASNLGSAFVTGNVFKIRTYTGGSTYGLNYSAHKVSLGDGMVTYDQWFAANAATYGFIYEGLVGNDKNNQAGQFRYVGTVHAAGVKAAGSLTSYIAAIKVGTTTSVTVGEETWTLLYKDVTADLEIEVGKNATYIVSGDNVGGVIVAYKAAK